MTSPKVTLHSSNPSKAKLEFTEFRKLPLSVAARNRLGAIAEAQVQHPDSNTKLLKLILANGYDPERGLYVPLSETPKLLGYYTRDIENLPMTVSTVNGWNLTHFLNPLTLPYEGLAKPSIRATNGGFLIVTHEFDCERKEQFEETLAWSANSGPFSELDKELQKYRDYRGYCILFAGRRSLHLNFLFDTRHLKYASSDAHFAQRRAEQDAYNAIMPRVYNIYWDAIDGLIRTILKPSIETDRKLRSIFQWRRTPFGNRVLDKPSDVLGLKVGTMIRQIVIKENIRTKASKGSDAFIVPEEFSAASPLGLRTGSGLKSGSANSQDTTLMFSEAEHILIGEWGEFPKLESIQLIGDEWVFRFYNHAGDTSPDTYVRGDYKKLDLVGKNAPVGKYFLPDDMTANEFGDYLARTTGQQSSVRRTDMPNPEQSQPDQPTEPAFEIPGSNPSRTTLPKGNGCMNLSQMKLQIERGWPLPMRGWPVSKVMEEYRKKLRSAVAACRDFHGVYFDNIILSGEGIGKTTAHMGFAVHETLFTALDRIDDHRRFCVFAFRSLDQAKEKAAEAETETGCNVVIIESFWKHYEEACKTEGVPPLPREQFHDRSVDGILRTIRDKQPLVFDRLETIRANIWPKRAGRSTFDSADTLIFTSHPTASSWPFSQLTRTWHHPDFEPSMDVEKQKELRNEFIFDKVIYDEPEIDEMLHIIPEKLFRHLTEQHESVNWKDLPLSLKRELFEQARTDGVLGIKSFESYDEWMRIQLDKLHRVEVDFAAIPFGHDNIDTGIYRKLNGTAFYLGPKQWLKHKGTHWTFLTTERLVTDVTEKAYEKMSKHLMALRLDNMPDVYPIRVPVFLDIRAGADRPGKDKISVLADEILKANSNAVVVADGVNDDIGAMSFQRMKGRNDLADRDVYIILTSLAPEVYGRLNAIGQWLGIPDIIELHYQGLINQAVGRNTGFRQQDNTKTVVVCSHRLWKQTISKLNLKRPRVLLYEVRQRPW